MLLRNFYPQIYIKAGSGLVSFTTQPDLTTALSTWTNMFGCETGAEIKESKGKDIELNTGDKVQLSKKLDCTITLLEATVANYNYLRATFHKVVSTIMFNQVYADGTGLVVEAKSIIPIVSKEVKSGDLIRIKITFSIESSAPEFQIVELPAA